MSMDSHYRYHRLRGLERLCGLELEEARVERVSCETKVEECNSRIGELRHQMQLAADKELSLVAGSAGVAPAMMQLLRSYMSWHAQSLAHEQQQLTGAQRAVDDAQDKVQRKFARLTAIRKLRARRWEELTRERYRTELWRADEQAIVASNHRGRGMNHGS